MPTVWGAIECVDATRGQVQVRAVMFPGVAIRILATVVMETLIARGTQRIGLPELQVGEFVELSYCNDADPLEADTIYVRPSTCQSKQGAGEGHVFPDAATPAEKSLTGFQQTHGERKE